MQITRVFRSRAKAFILVAACGASMGLATTTHAEPAVQSDASLRADVFDFQPDRCAVEQPKSLEEAGVRQDRNDWALQCGYISQSIYDYLYTGAWVWKFVSFAKNDRANGYPIWRPEDFDQLKKDGSGHFVNCAKPADVRLFTMCTAPSDG